MSTKKSTEHHQLAALNPFFSGAFLCVCVCKSKASIPFNYVKSLESIKSPAFKSNFFSVLLFLGLLVSELRELKILHIQAEKFSSS